MGLRMRKSFSVCKGVRVNLSGSGVGMSVGTKGLRHSIHSSGRRTNTVGIPGTGISYVSSSGSASRKYNSQAYANRQNVQTQRQQEKLNELEYNRYKVMEYNALIEVIKSIHKECDEQINWTEIQKSHAPFDINYPGISEKIAINQLNNYKPKFLEKIFKKKLEIKISDLQKRIELAKNNDREDYSNWEKLVGFSNLVLQGNIDAYFAVIADMNPLDDLLEFGSDFEFGADSSDILQVEFRVKSETTVPSYSLSQTKTGKLSSKNLTKTTYYDLVQDYVSSCSIRIARDMFALLPLNTVIVHAVDTVLNSATGYNEDVTILSVSFDKNTLNSLNFNTIDPSDSLINFKHNMKFMKTSGLKSVDRVL